MSLPYSLIGSENGTQNITVFVDGKVYTADDAHPNFDKIVEGARSGDKKITDLFDVLRYVQGRLVPLSERIGVFGSTVYFDGQPIHNALADQIARFFNEGADLTALVNFWEKLATNPSEHSREQLYRWLTAEKFTITDDGDIIGYKGLNSNHTAIHSGPGIVNGKVIANGNLDNSVGNVVEMDRSKVVHDPRSSCAFGLHVGTWEYAKGFAQGALVEVKVNPRDVVSVPTDCGGQKMRVSRYTVLADAKAKRTEAVVKAPVAPAPRLRGTDTRKNHLSQKRDSSGRFVSR